MFHRYNSNLRKLARDNRKVGNPAEMLLWKYLRGKQLGCQFNRQVPIGNFIVDFLCKEYSLIVEIDGDSHDGKLETDAERTAYLQGLGYSVLRFGHRDVLRNTPAIAGAIHEWIESRRVG